jgi:hypothetical protein
MVVFRFVIAFANVPTFSLVYTYVCALTIFISLIFRARTIIRFNKAILLRYEKRKNSETKKAALLAAHRSTLEEK